MSILTHAPAASDHTDGMAGRELMRDALCKIALGVLAGSRTEFESAERLKQ